MFMEKADYNHPAPNKAHVFNAGDVDTYQLRLINDNAGGTVTFHIAVVDEDGTRIGIDTPLETVPASSSTELEISSRNPQIAVTCTASSAGTANATVKCKAFRTTSPTDRSPITGTITGDVPGGVMILGYATAKIAGVP